MTYNKDFGLTPTYRYYYYPTTDATLVVRGAVAKFEHEVLVQYDDKTFKDTTIDISLRAQWNRDAGQRYFGRGPRLTRRTMKPTTRRITSSTWPPSARPSLPGRAIGARISPTG